MSSPQEQPDCFDVALLKGFHTTIAQSFQDCPELRSVSLVLDFRGDLNEAAKSGVFVTRSGGYGNADELYGGLQQTSRMMAKQLEAGIKLLGTMVMRNNELEKQRDVLVAAIQKLEEKLPTGDPEDPKG